MENIFDFVSLSDVRVFVFVVTLIRVNTKTVVWQEDLANSETVAFGLLARRVELQVRKRDFCSPSALNPRRSTPKG